LLRVQIFSICNPLLLYYAARGLHFVTPGFFTNVASVERIIFATFICAIFSRFTGAGSTWSPRNKMNPGDTTRALFYTSSLTSLTYDMGPPPVD
jgi:hypothetical protein